MDLLQQALRQVEHECLQLQQHLFLTRGLMSRVAAKVSCILLCSSHSGYTHTIKQHYPSLQDNTLEAKSH